MAERPLKLAVVGQFSSGKSALINAIIGQSVAKTGVRPLTAVLHRFSWAEAALAEFIHADGSSTTEAFEELAKLTEDGSQLREVLVRMPVESLKHVEIWDTPGFGSNTLGHEMVARKALADADLALWVTPIDHGLNQAEVDKLERLKRYDTPVLLVVNKADLADDAEERDEAVEDIAEKVGELAAKVVWVSAKQALAAKENDRPTELDASGFSSFEPVLAELLMERRTLRQAWEEKQQQYKNLGADNVICPDCGEIGLFDSSYCECGRSLSDQHRDCPRCKKDNTVSRTRCRGCGLLFADYERALEFAKQAEIELDLGLTNEALASLKVALEIDPDEPGRAKRVASWEGALERVEQLMNVADRQTKSKQAIVEWQRSIQQFESIGAGLDPHRNRLGKTALEWAEKALKKGHPSHGMSALDWARDQLGSISSDQVDLRDRIRRELVEQHLVEAAKSQSARLIIPAWTAALNLIGEGPSRQRTLLNDHVVSWVKQRLEASPPAAAASVAIGATPTVEFKDLLLDVVSEKTGYPVEMLEMEMEMEGDLGIDSIKRVEIRSSIREREPSLPEVDPTEMAALNTLGQIVEFMQAHAPAAVASVPLAADALDDAEQAARWAREHLEHRVSKRLAPLMHKVKKQRVRTNFTATLKAAKNAHTAQRAINNWKAALGYLPELGDEGQAYHEQLEQSVSDWAQWAIQQWGPKEATQALEWADDNLAGNHPARASLKKQLGLLGAESEFLEHLRLAMSAKQATPALHHLAKARAVLPSLGKDAALYGVRLKRESKRLLEAFPKKTRHKTASPPTPPTSNRTDHFEAEALDHEWVLCPKCVDAWKVSSASAWIRCPKCDAAYENPLRLPPKPSANVGLVGDFKARIHRTGMSSTGSHDSNSEITFKKRLRAAEQKSTGEGAIMAWEYAMQHGSNGANRKLLLTASVVNWCNTRTVNREAVVLWAKQHLDLSIRPLQIASFDSGSSLDTSPPAEKEDDGIKKGSVVTDRKSKEHTFESDFSGLFVTLSILVAGYILLIYVRSVFVLPAIIAGPLFVIAIRGKGKARGCAIMGIIGIGLFFYFSLCSGVIG